MAGTTSGNSVMNSTTGRSFGSRNCTQYAVGTTSNTPTTIVSTAIRIE